MSKKQKARQARRNHYDLAQFMRENYPFEEVREALKGRSDEPAAEYLGIDVDTLNVVIAYYRHRKQL